MTLASTATLKDIITALQTMECVNQKADLTSVVGSPALSTDNVATIISKLQAAKNTLAMNITAKGTTAAGTESVQALATKIASLSGVKRWAYGSGTSDSNSRFAVTGLSFTPTFFIAVDNYIGEGYQRHINLGVSKWFLNFSGEVLASLGGGNNLPAAVTFSSNGFTGVTNGSGAGFTWYAFE